MAKIAFLGLGQMGIPMAARLLQAGHHVMIWNRTPGRAAPLAQQGAVVASSPAEAATDVDFAITMLATPDALEEVTLGDDGIARSLRPGQILMDMSTVGPEAVRRMAARLPSGVSMVDAPVRGSVPQATGGTLDVFVGATDEDFVRVRPILEVLGRVQHVGGPGSGAALKLVINLPLGVAIVALGEAIAIGESLGLDRGIVLDVLADSPIGPTVKSKRANIESGHYPANFKLRHAAKDLRLVTDAATATGRGLRLSDAALAWLDDATERGAGDLDYSAVVATIVGEMPST